MIEDYDADFSVSTKNFSEYLVVVTRGNNPLSSVEDAIEDIRDFAQSFKVIYPTVQSQRILLSLLQRYKVRGKRIHDVELAAVALANRMGGVATFNEKDFAAINEIKTVKP